MLKWTKMSLHFHNFLWIPNIDILGKNWTFWNIFYSPCSSKGGLVLLEGNSTSSNADLVDFISLSMSSFFWAFVSCWVLSAELALTSLFFCKINVSCLAFSSSFSRVPIMEAMPFLEICTSFSWKKWWRKYILNILHTFEEFWAMRFSTIKFSSYTNLWSRSSRKIAFLKTIL